MRGSREKNKQGTTQSDNSQIGFLLKFIQRNFERRSIDQQSFLTFNKFVAALGDQIREDSGPNDIKIFVSMIDTVFMNYHEPFWKKSTFGSVFQLLELCLKVLQRAISHKLKPQSLYELINLFWPIYDPTKPIEEKNYEKYEEKIKKMNLPDSIKDTEFMKKNISTKDLLVQISQEKYEHIISQCFQQIQTTFDISHLFNSYLAIQGQRYLKTLFELAKIALNGSAVEQFTKITKIVQKIGSTQKERQSNMINMVEFLLKNQPNVESIHSFLKVVGVEKLYSPDKLFSMVIDIMDMSLKYRRKSTNFINLLDSLLKYRQIFLKVKKIEDPKKLQSLLNKIIQFLVYGYRKAPEEFVLKGDESQSQILRSIEGALQFEGQKQKDKKKSKKKSKEGGKNPFAGSEQQMPIFLALDADTLQKKRRKNSQGSSESASDDEICLDYERLKYQDFEKVLTIFKTFLNTLFKNRQIFKILKTTYQGKDNADLKKLITCLSRASRNNFLKLYETNPSTQPHKNFIDFIVNIYSQFLIENVEEIFSQARGEFGDSPCLLKLLKLRIAEETIIRSKFQWDQIFQKYYKPHFQLMINKNMSNNFHFLYLSVLHEYIIDSPYEVISFLVSKCEEQSFNQNSQQLKCVLSLITNLMEAFSSIRLKFNYQTVRKDIRKLNQPFSITSFMFHAEYKEQKMLPINNIQLQDSSEEKEKNYYNLIAKLLNKIIQTQMKLPVLLKTNNISESSLYFMMMIELNRLCMEKSTQKIEYSSDMDTVVTLRKNNRLSLALTLTNQFKAILGDITDLQVIGLEKKSIVFHLLKKLQILVAEKDKSVQDPNKSSQIMNQGKDKLAQMKMRMNVESLPHLNIGELKKLILRYIWKIGQNPSYNLLKNLNKIIKGESQIASVKNGEGNSSDRLNNIFTLKCKESQELQSKSVQFQTYIRDLQMIKFYSESISDQDKLILLSVKSGLKLLQNSKFFNQQSSSQEQQMIDEKEQMEEKDKITALNLLYNNIQYQNNDRQKKNAQIYIKLKLLTQAECQQKKQIAQKEIKQIISMLQTNHEDLEQILIKEEEENSQNVQNSSSILISKLFTTKTKFMGYLMQKIIKNSSQSQSSEDILGEDKNNTNNPEISLLLLNMFKTLIDNNSTILQITQQQLCHKISNHETISHLILNRTRHGVKVLVTAYKEEKKPSVQGLNRKSQRKAMRQIDGYLEENKKMYKIIGKILSCQTQNLTISSLKIVDQILSFDELQTPYVSIYLLREIINISPIMKLTLSNQQWSECTQTLFGYLMKIKQNFDDVPLVVGRVNSQQKGKDTQKAGSQQENSLSMANVVNYFLWEFYEIRKKEMWIYKATKQEKQSKQKQVAKQIMDKVTAQKQNNISEEEKMKKMPALKKKCLQSQKTVTYKCLQCSLEICLNCMYQCHIGHPIIFVVPSLVSIKNCQCKDKMCLIIMSPNHQNAGEDKKDALNSKQSIFNERQRLRDQRHRLREQERMWVRQKIAEKQGQIFIPQDMKPSRYEDRRNPSRLSPTERFQAMIQFQDHPPQPSEGSRFGMPNLNPRYPPMMPPMMGVPPPGGSSGPGNIFSVYGGPPDNIFGSGRRDRGDREREDRMQRQVNYRAIMIQKQRLSRDLMERERRQIQIQKQILLRNKQRMSFGDNPFGIEEKQRLIRERQKIKQGEQQEDEFVDEHIQYQNYQQILSKFQDGFLDLSVGLRKKIMTSYNFLREQAYLLGIFMTMAAEICEKNIVNQVEEKQEVSWHIRLEQPLKINPKLTSCGYKMCGGGSFQTKLRKADGSIHPSPCVSRTAFSMMGKFLFFITGPNINVYHKQKFISYILQNKIQTIALQYINQQPQQLSISSQAHSIVAAPFMDSYTDGDPTNRINNPTINPLITSITTCPNHNVICLASLHQLAILEYNVSNGALSRAPISKTNINNDNINKIMATKLGIFVGVSREIRLYSYSLKQIVTLQCPDALVKEWYVSENGRGTGSYTVYVTINDGYILYSEVNSWSSGSIPLTKKIFDSRPNRPVGSFVIAKEVPEYGTLMFSSYKDKSIGHSIGRLDDGGNGPNSTLVDINYIKLFNQGIDGALDTNYSMGLTDFIEQSPQEEKSEDKKKSSSSTPGLYMTTLFKTQLNDAMSVHRGLLSVIRLYKDSNSNSNVINKYQAQILGQGESRCEYFQIIKLQDGKHWFILSLHQDGALLIHVPQQIPKQCLEKELKLLKEKKNDIYGDKDSKGNNGNNEQAEEEDSKMNKAEEEAKRKIDFFRSMIKENINLKSIKQNLSKMGSMDHYTYLAQSDILKIKEDYILFQTEKSNTDVNARKFVQIKYTNDKKIITGVSLPYCCDVILPTRKINNIFEFGLTFDESLYFYAFGVLKMEVRKHENQKYVRDSLKSQILQQLMKKKKDGTGLNGEITIQDRMIMQKSLTSNSLQKLSSTQIQVYGENIETSFNPKASRIIPEFYSNLSNQSLFELDFQEKIEMVLKNIQIFLDNTLQTENFSVTSEEIEEFVTAIRDNLIISNKKMSSSGRRGQEVCNKMYPLTKNILIKSLIIKQKLEQTPQLHVFNDKFHPVRYATETKIEYLYDNLSKGEITDPDCILLVNEMYGFSGCFSINEEPQKWTLQLLSYIRLSGEESKVQMKDAMQKIMNSVFSYYIAKYPAMLNKLYKKIKLLEKNRVLYKLVPLYLMGYVVFKYLGYHTEWITMALSEVVGKNLVHNRNDFGIFNMTDGINISQQSSFSSPMMLAPTSVSRPDPFARYVLFRFLVRYQNYEPEAWLKNVQGLDVIECLQQNSNINNPANEKQIVNEQRGGLGGGFNPMMFDMMDEEAALKMALQLSQMDMQQDQPNMDNNFDEPMIEEQQNEMMEQQKENQEVVLISPLIKDLIDNILKDIDYNSNSIDNNCWKGLVLFVINKVALANSKQKQKKKNLSGTIGYLYKSIKNVIAKICANFQDPGNTNIHTVLVFWLNLFGLIFESADKQSQEYETHYGQAKEEIMNVLNTKVQVQTIKKEKNGISNLFFKLTKGVKVISKIPFIYGLISVLQAPCQANYVLMTLQCYQLFRQNKDFYNRTKYIDTIREGEKNGNVKKIYETALENIDTWKEIGDPEWLGDWIEQKNTDWNLALELLALYYE